MTQSLSLIKIVRLPFSDFVGPIIHVSPSTFFFFFTVWTDRVMEMVISSAFVMEISSRHRPNSSEQRIPVLVRTKSAVVYNWHDSLFLLNVLAASVNLSNVSMSKARLGTDLCFVAVLGGSFTPYVGNRSYSIKPLSRILRKIEERSR